MNETTYAEEVPGAEEFVGLRVSAGLSRNTIKAAELGLNGSWYSICVRDGDELIGMGRVIGDGGCFFQVVDIAVHPRHQRRGIGYGIMDRLMTHLRKNAPKSAYISLFADGGAPKLYEKFGFKFTAPTSVGMALRI